MVKEIFGENIFLAFDVLREFSKHRASIALTT
jgi:hypothetical protein